MLVTVAIPTLNRAESLRRTLASLADMQVPRDLDWEVVVVNNNSTDHTDGVINEFRERLPVRGVLEPRRGHASARNRAVDAGKGKYFVWTDDDVVVDPGWLEAYLGAFRRWPEAALFGGPISPRYSIPLPRWLREIKELPVVKLWLYGGRNLGDAVQPLPVNNMLPIGANFAVRTKELRQFRFNAEFGDGLGQRRLGEETDMMWRMMRSGAAGYWLPQAKIEHCIPQEHQTLRYLMRYYARYGETSAFENDRGGNIRSLYGVPLWIWRRLFAMAVGYSYHRALSPTEVWVDYLSKLAWSWGMVRYYRNLLGSTQHQNDPVAD